MEGLGQGEGVCFLISDFAVGLGSCCAYIDCQAGEQGVVALLVGLILQWDSGMVFWGGVINCFLKLSSANSGGRLVCNVLSATPQT